MTHPKLRTDAAEEDSAHGLAKKIVVSLVGYSLVWGLSAALVVWGFVFGLQQLFGG